MCSIIPLVYIWQIKLTNHILSKHFSDNLHIIKSIIYSLGLVTSFVPKFHHSIVQERTITKLYSAWYLNVRIFEKFSKIDC